MVRTFSDFSGIWLVVDYDSYFNHSASYRALVPMQLKALSQVFPSKSVGLCLIKLSRIKGFRISFPKPQAVSEHLRARHNIAEPSAGAIGIAFLISLIRLAHFTVGATFRALFSPSAFPFFVLGQTFRSVKIGPIVMSESLMRRYRVASNGRAKISREMLSSFFSIVFSLSQLETIDFPLENHYYSSPEPVYSPEAVGRFLQVHSGMGRVVHNLAGTQNVIEPQLTEKTQVGISPYNSIPTQYRVIPMVQGAKRIATRLKAGFPSDLPYMNIPLAAEPEEEADSPDSLLSATACIWLHDFGDGEFVIGDYGYSSLLEWAIDSVDTLLSVPGSKILVKAHPTEISRYSESARRSSPLSKMIERYRSNSRVAFIDSSKTTGEITSKYGVQFGVTLYGTVAEELAWCGIPCIANHLAPYGDRAFVSTWRSRTQYVRLLQSAAVSRLPDPDKKSLLMYLASKYENYDSDLHGLLNEFFQEKGVDILRNRTVEEKARLALNLGWEAHIAEYNLTVEHSGRQESQTT